MAAPAALRAVVLGSAAGGGYPQWNCRCAVCEAAWAGTEPARTQSSLAVSADGERWLLLNASPDLRSQILATPALQPRAGRRRDSPIAAVIVTNADVDHVAGLLTLREGHAFTLHATEAVHAVLDDNPIFGVLPPDRVPRRHLPIDAAFQPEGPDGPLGLTVEAFRVPGKVALYMEGREENLALDRESDDTIGLRLSAGGRSLHYLPGCAALTPALLRRLDGADCLLFDGTVWQDTEMAATGVGEKTGRRMGHLPIDGPDGSLAGLADVAIGRRIYVHVNNTNPILCSASPERARVVAAGWEVAHDGLVVDL